MNLLPGSEGCHFCSFPRPGQTIWPSLMTARRRNSLSPQGGAGNVYEPQSGSPQVLEEEPLCLLRSRRASHTGKTAARPGFLDTSPSTVPSACSGYTLLFIPCSGPPIPPHSSSPQKQNKPKQNLELWLHAIVWETAVGLCFLNSPHGVFRAWLFSQ